MLPVSPDAVVVHRVVDAAEDDVVDALTEFAVSHKLELDRTYDGDGLLFRAARNAPESAMFRNHDTLHVLVFPTVTGTEVTLSASMRGLHERGDAWKRGRMLRGSIVSAVLVGAGITGIAQGINPGDFIPIGIGAVWMSRTVRAVLGENDSREELERAVANELHRLSDGMSG